MGRPAARHSSLNRIGPFLLQGRSDQRQLPIVSDDVVWEIWMNSCDDDGSVADIFVAGSETVTRCGHEAAVMQNSSLSEIWTFDVGEFDSVADTHSLRMRRFHDNAFVEKPVHLVCYDC